jgi:hypothetical protein
MYESDGYTQKDRFMSTHENAADCAVQGPDRDAPESSPDAQDAGRAAAARPTVHESDIFPPPTGARYFGTGSYEMGGTHAEGSDAIGDLNALGGYGTFSDAGGPGSATLYGEELPKVSGAPAEGDAAESPQLPPGKPT